MDYLKAFLIGGFICAAVQILMEKTKLLARPDYGAACMYRHCHGCAGALQADH